MCGGSKKQTTNSTSTYTPNGQALDAYGNAIDQAQQVAQTPFNYDTTQNIAGFTPQQQQAFNQIGQMQGVYAPYLDAASQYNAAGAAPITGAQIQNYQNPYQQQVIDATMANINHQNAVQQQQVLGNAAAQNALGGNRVGIAQAELARGQAANTNSTIAGLLNQGYNSALGAAQSDAQRQMAAGQNAANYGSLAQNLGLQGSQALYNAGASQQQQLQNVYNAASGNQQAATMWPYQNQQFQAAILGALGPLMGGTTTGNSTTTQTSQPGLAQYLGAGLSVAGALSDERAKEDIEPIGKLHDGQTIYKFRYKGEPETHIGLIAQEVEKRHPEAVGEVGGLKTVDYDRATKDAEYASGGSVDMSGFSFPFMQLQKAQPVVPQLPSAPHMDNSGDQAINPQAAYDIGKKARSGINNILTGMDPAKGWGASVEPANSANPESGNFLQGMGGTLADYAGDIGSGIGDVMGDIGGGIGGLFGFANGGSNLPTPVQLQGSAYLPAAGSAPGAAPDSYYAQGLADLARSRNAPVQQGVAPAQTNPSIPTTGHGKGLGGMLGSLFGIGGDGGSNDGQGFDWSQLFHPSQGHADGGDVNPYGGIEGYFDVPQDQPAQQQIAPFDTQDVNAQQPDKPFSLADLYGGDLTSLTKPTASLADASPVAKASPVSAEDVKSGEISPSGGLMGGQDMDVNDPLSLIKREEGFSPTAQWDIKQYSGGYGSKAAAGETFDEAKADQYLRRDAKAPMDWVSKNAPDATPAQKAALTSFGYNEGTGALDKLKADIDSGDWSKVGDHMLLYNKSRDANGELQFNQGLANRRQREVALVTGGDIGSSATSQASSPASSAQVAPALKSAVQKGLDPDAPQVSKGYANTADRQSGGLLKRLFGIDFNPLNLSENERMGLVAAGLGMMSTGNIGSGGLQGLEYMQQANKNDRDAQLAAAKLRMELAPKFQKIGQDAFGNDAMGWVDPYKQTVVPLTPTTGGSATSNSQPIQEAINNGTHGEEFLKTLPPEQANLVRKYANYELPVPAASRNNPQMMRILSYAEQYRPGFSAQDYKVQQNLKNSFTSGADAKEVQSYNTVMDHLVQANDAVDALGNSRSSWVNQPRNAIRGQTDKQFQDARSTMLSKMDVAISEVNKATTGKPITVDERKAWRDRLDQNASPVDLHTTMKAFTEMIKSRMDASAAKWNQGMKVSESDPGYKSGEGLLTPKAKSQYDKIMGQNTDTAHTETQKFGPAEGDTATNPKTGERIIMKNGKWVPMQ